MLLHSISTGITPLSQRQLAQNVCELPRSHDHHDDDDDASPVVIAGPGKTQAFAIYIYVCMYKPASQKCAGCLRFAVLMDRVGI